MRRELRIIALVILAAAGLSVFTVYKQSAKPTPVPPLVAETKPEPRPVRVIQIHNTPSDQVHPPEKSPAPVLEPIKDFPDTTTTPLLPPAPPPAIVELSLPKPTTDICEQHHMHKRYTNNGKSWRCVKN